jgi:hypothetical protein
MIVRLIAAAVTQMLLGPQRLSAQHQLPSRFAPRVDQPLVALRIAPVPEQPRMCESSVVRSMAEGAFAGALMTTLLVVAASPILAIASIGSSDSPPVGAIIAGGAAVGAIFALVAHQKRCASGGQ